MKSKRFETRDMLLLTEVLSHWNAMSEFRSDRRRCKRYCYGRQWDDYIEVDGQMMKEEEYIRSQGNVPLKNNLIRRLVRSVLGVFRNQYSYPTPESLELDTDNPDMSRLYDRLLRNAGRNRLSELHARTMEEFLISGMAIHRKAMSRSVENSAIIPSDLFLTNYVNPDSFFVDSSTRDFRGWDVGIIGQFHDIDFLGLCSALNVSQEEAQELRSIYGGDALNGKCRVIEVWKRESTERYRIHDRRSGVLYKIEAGDYDDFRSAHAAEIRSGSITLTWMVENVWRYYFLSPEGHILASGISPLPGGGHPFVWKAYPYIDGEIHSFVADIIDQQRHTNRLITLYDWVIRSSAKGVLLFPESALPDNVDIDDISDEWSRFNGVILFRPKAGMPLPQQVSGGASQTGITDLLNIQLKMLEDVSGVNGALEGKVTSGSVSGTLYNQQTRQAMTALLDILESYNAFILEGARLDK